MPIAIAIVRSTITIAMRLVIHRHGHIPHRIAVGNRARVPPHQATIRFMSQIMIAVAGHVAHRHRHIPHRIAVGNRAIIVVSDKTSAIIIATDHRSCCIAVFNGTLEIMPYKTSDTSIAAFIRNIACSKTTCNGPLEIIPNKASSVS